MKNKNLLVILPLIIGLFFFSAIVQKIDSLNVYASEDNDSLKTCIPKQASDCYSPETGNIYFNYEYVQIGV